MINVHYHASASNEDSQWQYLLVFGNVLDFEGTRTCGEAHINLIKVKTVHHCLIGALN